MTASGTHRVVVLGKSLACAEVLQMLASHARCEIVGVVPNVADDGSDRASSVRYVSDTQGHPVLESAGLTEFVQANGVDFLFSVQHDRIIKRDLIEAPNVAAINLHFSPLPQYRGVAPITWALRNCESRYGVTLHYIDEGVDTGDIIAVRRFGIADVRTAKQLYDRCLVHAIDLFAECLDDVLARRNPRQPQDNAQASYFRMGEVDFSETSIDFRRTARTVVGHARALIFPPHQFPTVVIDGGVRAVTDIAPDYRPLRLAPGTVIEHSGSQARIATHDCSVWVTLLEDDSAGGQR